MLIRTGQLKLQFIFETSPCSGATSSLVTPLTSVIFVNENENGEKRENNEFVNEN